MEDSWVSYQYLPTLNYLFTLAIEQTFTTLIWIHKCVYRLTMYIWLTSSHLLTSVSFWCLVCIPTVNSGLCGHHQKVFFILSHTPASLYEMMWIFITFTLAVCNPLYWFLNYMTKNILVTVMLGIVIVEV